MDLSNKKDENKILSTWFLQDSFLFIQKKLRKVGDLYSLMIESNLSDWNSYSKSVKETMKRKIELNLQIYLNLIELWNNMKQNAIYCFKKYVWDQISQDSTIFSIINKGYIVAYKNSLNIYIDNMK